jgi:hypothetical protein
MQYAEERLLFCSIKGSWCDHDEHCEKCKVETRKEKSLTNKFYDEQLVHTNVPRLIVTDKGIFVRDVNSDEQLSKLLQKAKKHLDQITF